jgi:ferrous-iron efflux pump FieF
VSGAHEHRHSHGDLTTRAAIASVSTALFLLLLKAYAAWTTGSVAMLGSLADTALDGVASLITLFGVRLAATPADEGHRFGHGKAEALAALAQVGIITFSAVGIGWRAVARLIEGEATANAEYGIAVSAVAIATTMGLLWYQRSVIARTGSVAIAADHVHYQSDLLLNVSVIAALVLDQYLGLTGADALFGVAIAVWLLFGAWKASSSAIDQLMDKEWPEEKRARFLAVAARHPELKGIHDLRTRTSGMHDFVQFHVWVDPAMTVAEAHRVMDEVEHKLEHEFPGCEILIHVDPEGQVDQPGNALAERDLTPQVLRDGLSADSVPAHDDRGPAHHRSS